MNTRKKVMSWVVYNMPIRNKPQVMTAVCEQSEWEAMERAQPGYYTLVKAGILNEGEAENYARYGPTGAPAPVPYQKIPRS